MKEDAHADAAHPLSYTDHGDGTITDGVAGLMWQRWALGRSGASCLTGTSTLYDWYEAAGVADATHNPGAAIDACGVSTVAGYSDWRLPTVRELAAIAQGRYGPAIDTAAFADTSSVSYFPRRASEACR